MSDVFNEYKIPYASLKKEIHEFSYELDEIINLSDNIAVIHDGKLWAELDYMKMKSSSCLKEDLGLFMAGGRPT